ncbi:hypothetical protein DFH09DRAFT_1108986, partial [Mycena vulgaris]
GSEVTADHGDHIRSGGNEECSFECKVQEPGTELEDLLCFQVMQRKVPVRDETADLETSDRAAAQRNASVEKLETNSVPPGAELNRVLKLKGAWNSANSNVEIQVGAAVTNRERGLGRERELAQFEPELELEHAALLSGYDTSRARARAEACFKFIVLHSDPRRGEARRGIASGGAGGHTRRALPLLIFFFGTRRKESPEVKPYRDVRWRGGWVGVVGLGLGLGLVLGLELGLGRGLGLGLGLGLELRETGRKITLQWTEEAPGLVVVVGGASWASEAEHASANTADMHGSVKRYLMSGTTT